MKQEDPVAGTDEEDAGGRGGGGHGCGRGGGFAGCDYAEGFFEEAGAEGFTGGGGGVGGVGGGGVGEAAHGVFEEGFFGGATRHGGWECWDGVGAGVREGLEMLKGTMFCHEGADWGKA